MMGAGAFLFIPEDARGPDFTRGGAGGSIAGGSTSIFEPVSILDLGLMGTPDPSSRPGQMTPVLEKRDGGGGGGGFKLGGGGGTKGGGTREMLEGPASGSESFASVTISIGSEGVLVEG